METNPIFQCWCIFFTKLLIFQDRIEIRQFFGANTIVVPLKKVASVTKSITGISFETTGGGKTETIQPWTNDNRQKIVDLVTKIIS